MRRIVGDKQQALELLAAYRRDLPIHPNECMMCALVSGRDPSLPIAENDTARVLLDRFGYRVGHIQVVAKRCVEHATDLTWREYSELQRLVYEACGVLKRVVQPDRIYIAALGVKRPKETTFPHYHAHVIPIPRGEDARPADVFSWTNGGVVVYEAQELEELAGLLRAVWPAPGEL